MGAGVPWDSEGGDPTVGEDIVGHELAGAGESGAQPLSSAASTATASTAPMTTTTRLVPTSISDLNNACRRPQPDVIQGILGVPVARTVLLRAGVESNRRAGPQASNLVRRTSPSDYRGLCGWSNPWRHVEHTGLRRGGIVSLEVRADEVEEQTDNRIALMAELVKQVVSCGVCPRLVHVEELSRGGSPRPG